MDIGLISLHMMSSVFAHVVAYGGTSFLFMAEQYSICVYPHFVTHSSLNGHLDCSHLYEVPKTVKRIEAERSMVVTRGWVQENGDPLGSQLLMGI